MAKDKKILGHIIALTKSIYLREPADGSGYLSQFRGGNGTRSDPFRVSGIYLNWWITERSRKLAEEIAEMAMRLDPNLQDGNRKSLAKTVEDVLQDNALNSNLFEFRKSFGGVVDTLFEARALTDVNQFAEHLWDKIYSTLSASISKWLIIYPLIKIKSSSVDIGLDGLRLVAPDDRIRWQQLAAQYRIQSDWDPTTGAPQRLISKTPYETCP